MIMSLKQRKIKFEPRIELNHNKYTPLLCLLLSLLVPTVNGGEVSPKASCMLHVCLVALAPG